MLLNLIKDQRPDIDKIYLYVKDLFDSKYQLLINVREEVGTKKFKNPEVFIGYSQTIYHVYENLEDYNPTKKRRVLIALDDMIADIEYNKNLRLNATYYFIVKIPNKRELQQIVSNYSCEVDFKGFMKLHKDYTKDLFKIYKI